MKNYNKTFKDIDKSYANKLNLELKLSYLLTDIIYKSDRSSLIQGLYRHSRAVTHN